jgi:hypothetical protein
VEHDAGWRGAVPAAIVAQHRPEISGFRLATPGVQNRGGGFVDIEPCAALFQRMRRFGPIDLTGFGPVIGLG